jgi:rubrerythrin
METKNLLDAVRVVKESERQAAEFYGKAAETASNWMGKQVFTQLKEFEQFHYARLTVLEQSLEQSGKFISYEGREFPQPPAIVPEPTEEPQQQTVIKIIVEAMELETKAEKAYADLADQVTDKEGHAMFRRLSEEEHGHYRFLREAYWNLSNFKTWKWTQS